eukprot:465534_1
MDIQLGSVTSASSIDTPLSDTNSEINTVPSPQEIPEYDVNSIDSKIHKLWNQVLSKPTAEDIEYSNTTETNKQLMTSRNEILGWIIWDWANSPMWQVINALAWALFVVNNATEYACERYTTYGCDVNNKPILANEKLKIKIGSIELKPESFYFLVISFSGIVQLFSYIMIGGLMDYKNYQFYIFKICAIIAALFNIPYIFLTNAKSFMFAGFWTAIGLTFYGLAEIAYNSHLVDIVDNHWLLRRAQRNNTQTDDACKIRNTIADDISTFGVSCGYIGSLIMTLFTAVMFVTMNDVTYKQFDGFGVTSDMKTTEMYAEFVYGCTIRYFYDYDEQESQIAAIQLFYNDINLNGSYIGNRNVSSANLNYNQEIFISNSKISKILLWYNDDNTVAGIQFETEDAVQSNIFGNVTNLGNGLVIKMDSNSKHEYVFGGYDVYTDVKNGNIIVSGFDFLFLSTNGQWSSTLSIRLVILSVCIWWMGWQLITIITMKYRVKNDLPQHSNIFTISIKNTWKTISETFTKYPNIKWCMIAWFFYSDAVGTAGNTCILFAKIELDMNSVELILIILEYELVGAIGGVFIVWLQKKLQWDCRKIIVYHLVFYAVVSCYPLIGFIPNSPIGLVSKIEMYIFVFIFSFQIASLQGFSRALTSNLIPTGKENEIFSLYAITDKGSSWIGPLITGLISNSFGLRWAMFYVVLFFIICVPIILKIDLQQGMIQAGKINLKQKHKK